VLLPLLALTLLQATEPGPVVLLGERADASQVDELRDLSGPSVLLTLADDETDAASLGGGEHTARRALPRDDLIAVDAGELAEAVRSARHVALAPGPLGDWFATLWPRRRESQLVRALWEAHRGGAGLVGRGSSAGLLSAATVIEGPEEIGERERNPHRLEGPRAVWAAGFQPWAVLDSEGASAGGLERLVRVLIDERLRLGVLVESRGALVYDAPGARFVARGAGGVLVLDLRNARRREEALLGARLSRLRAGDAWIRRFRTLTPARGASEATVEERAEERSVDDVLALAALTEALTVFDAPAVPRRLVLVDARRTLTLEVDDDADVWRHEPGGTSLATLALDLEPRRP
jgi:cyanophycinase-like exopeptidase